MGSFPGPLLPDNPGRPYQEAETPDIVLTRHGVHRDGLIQALLVAQLRCSRPCRGYSIAAGGSRSGPADGATPHSPALRTPSPIADGVGPLVAKRPHPIAGLCRAIALRIMRAALRTIIRAQSADKMLHGLLSSRDEIKRLPNPIVEMNHQIT